MSRKTFIWGGMTIGSTVGGFVPMLWSGGLFSFTSVVLTAVGGILGVWAGFKLAQYLGV